MSGQGYMNPRFVSKDDLRRRITELEAENKAQRLDWMTRQNAIDLERKQDEAASIVLTRELKAWQQRAEQAEAELAAVKGRRCRNCKSWDDEDVEEVAAVRFSWCRNGMATKEFKSVVVSEGWLCPCWAAREETP